MALNPYSEKTVADQIWDELTDRLEWLELKADRLACEWDYVLRLDRENRRLLHERLEVVRNGINTLLEVSG